MIVPMIVCFQIPKFYHSLHNLQLKCFRNPTVTVPKSFHPYSLQGFIIHTSSSRASRGRKFQKKKELYSKERICL